MRRAIFRPEWPVTRTCVACNGLATARVCPYESRVPEKSGASCVPPGRYAGFLLAAPICKRELEINGIPVDRIRVVHPVPAALQTPEYREMNSSQEILFVGQIIRGKGVDLMLRALARLEGEWHATIVGDGNHLGDCRALASRLGIGDRVKFTGWIDHHELDGYYSAARLMVVPSRWPETIWHGRNRGDVPGPPRGCFRQRWDF